MQPTDLGVFNNIMCFENCHLVWETVFEIFNKQY